MSSFAAADGTRLAFRCAGTGPLLVCQPGGPGRASAYLEDLGGLSAQRTLVLLDARATGRSEVPADPSTLRFDRLAEDVDALREHLGQDRIDLLGHSAGAMVAQAYAAAHPDRIGSLVLVTPTDAVQRGSGARALAGMAPVRGRYRRPLLATTRGTTTAACAEAGLVPWSDPHNDDPAYARVRVRAAVLPVLEEQLGPGVAAALARSAQQLREDADALDALTPDTDDVAVLRALPAALRGRALKRWAERACGRAVTAAHVDALRSLVEDWHGQGPVALPGGVRARRDGARLASGP